MKTAGCLTDSRFNLDTDPLPLTANGLTQIVHLGAYDVIDRFACSIHVLAHRLGDLVNGK
jgi:hypothetical protein